ncbi:MAG: ABC transporter permease [Gammaproteobacteria bacterium]
MVTELWQSRQLIWRLIVRDISVRYRQSLLGYLWAILPQITTVGIFTFLAQQRVFPMGELEIPYAAYAVWNVSVWQLFSGCLVGSTNSLANAGALVTKINFCKASLVIAAVGTALFDFLIRLFPVAIVFIWLRYIPDWHAVFIPFILVLVILMALGFGFVLSILNLALKDIGNAVSMLLTFGMFFAPILYPPPVREPFDLVNTVNPFSPLLIATQDLLTGHQLSQPMLLPIAAVLCVTVFLLGWYVFYLTMPRVAERA